MGVCFTTHMDQRSWQVYLLQSFTVLLCFEVSPMLILLLPKTRLSLTIEHLLLHANGAIPMQTDPPLQACFEHAVCFYTINRRNDLRTWSAVIPDSEGQNSPLIAGAEFNARSSLARRLLVCISKGGYERFLLLVTCIKMLQLRCTSSSDIFTFELMYAMDLKIKYAHVCLLFMMQDGTLEHDPTYA